MCIFKIEPTPNLIVTRLFQRIFLDLAQEQAIQPGLFSRWAKIGFERVQSTERPFSRAKVT